MIFYKFFAISLDSLSISNTSFILLISEIEALFKVFSTILCIDKKEIFSLRKASTAISLAAFKTVGALFFFLMKYKLIQDKEILKNLVHKKLVS